MVIDITTMIAISGIVYHVISILIGVIFIFQRLVSSRLNFPHLTIKQNSNRTIFKDEKQTSYTKENVKNNK